MAARGGAGDNFLPQFDLPNMIAVGNDTGKVVEVQFISPGLYQPHVFVYGRCPHAHNVPPEYRDRIGLAPGQTRHRLRYPLLGCRKLSCRIGFWGIADTKDRVSKQVQATFSTHSSDLILKYPRRGFVLAGRIFSKCLVAQASQRIANCC